MVLRFTCFYAFLCSANQKSHMTWRFSPHKLYEFFTHGRLWGHNFEVSSCHKFFLRRTVETKTLFAAIMKLSLVLPILPFLPSACQAADGAYSYNPEDEYNPSNWAAVAVADNQCGGNAQSGIDIPSSKCTVFDEYVMTVRPACLPCFAQMHEF